MLSNILLSRLSPYIDEMMPSDIHLLKSTEKISAFIKKKNSNYGEENVMKMQAKIAF
jgi:hypothetical protein